MKVRSESSSVLPQAQLIALALAACALFEAPESTRDAAARELDITETRALAAWNEIAFKATSSSFSPPRETRALAIMSVAVFDAVNGITRMYEPHTARITAGRDASVHAAITAAAHHVLTSLYPAASALLDAARDSALGTVSQPRAKEQGIAAGRAAAAAALASRNGDGADVRVSHQSAISPGVWVPTPPAFVGALEPAWGKVKPWMLNSGDQFRPTPPPAIDSDVYARDYAEIIRVGGSTSAERTAAQTQVARFWIATAGPLWNQLVRQLTVARHFDVTSAAHAYLVLNCAGADAFVAAWDAKYAYNQWRPVTAIRHAAGADSNWLPLLITPPFPDYPAGHTAFGGAAEYVLTAIFGDEPGELRITSPTASASHTYRTFAAVSEEVVNARVWGGVHWRTSSTAGRDMGRRVGEHAISRAPKRTGGM
jgi:hypothetical protein